MSPSGNALGSASGASKRSWMPCLKRSTTTTFTSKAEAETQNPATPSAPRERLAGFLPPHALPPTGDRAPGHWRKKRPAVADSNHIQDGRHRRSRCFRTSSFLPACRQVSFAHPKRMGRRFLAFYLETPCPENKRLGRSPRRSHPGVRPCTIPNSALSASRTLPAIVQRSRQSNPRVHTSPMPSFPEQTVFSQADRHCAEAKAYVR